MDFGKALTYYTKDEKFVSVVAIFSLLILSCIFILPLFFVVPLMVGYSIDLVRRIQNGDFTLPEIQYSEQWKKGIMLCIIQIAVGIVLAIIQTIILLPFGLLFGASVAVTSSSTRSTGYNSAAVTGTSLIYNLVSLVVRLVFNYATAIISMAMLAIYAKTDNVNSLVNMDNYKKLYANNGTALLLAPIVVGIAGGVVMFVGVLACCVGVLPAAVVVSFMQAGVTGQIKVTDVSAQ